MTIATLKQSMDLVTRLERRMRNQVTAVDRRFASADQPFEAIEWRFETVDKRFDDLEARLTARIDMRFESLSEKIDVVLTHTKVMRDQFERVADEHEHRLRDLEKRLPH
jgi:predicted  nucleic acid-binding Zn-ribbon protein